MNAADPMIPYFIYGFVILTLVLILGRVLSPFLMLLRMRFKEYHFTRLHNAELTPLHRKLLDELAELGFHSRIDFSLEIYARDYTGFVLTHDTLPVVAHVLCYPWQCFSYPVNFESVTPEGKMLSTLNMLPGLLPYPGVEYIDAQCATLAEHFQAHLTRIKDMQLITEPVEKAYARRVQFNADYTAYQIAQGKYIRAGENDLYYSTASAWKVTRQMMRLRKAVKRGYKGLYADEEYQSRFFAECYQFQEDAYKLRKGRRRVNATLLLITIAITYAIWGEIFDWYFATSILVLLMVHEYGHAIVMYLFGYRDMSMFFIPMMGAVVTGKIDNISAGKQAIIYFAGPVPGLLFGLGMLLYGNFYFPHWWNSEAIDWITIVAVILNLFNLLPLVPLDGGRLVEIALFLRWPRFAPAFYWFSCLSALALGFYDKSALLFFLAYVMAKSAQQQKRVLALSREWNGTKGDVSELPALFSLARGKVKRKDAFLAQYRLVRPLFVPPQVSKPSIMESVVTMTALIALWAAAGATYLVIEHTKAAQERFASQLSQYFDLQKIVKADSPKLQLAYADVEAAAAELSPRDPYQVDMLMLRYAKLPPETSKPLYEHLIETGQQGRSYTTKYIVSAYILNAMKLTTQQPQGATERFKNSIELVERNAHTPDAIRQSARARLRLVQLYDREKSPLAQQTLDELLSLINTFDKYMQMDIMRAQIWFYIDKGKAADAVAFVEHSTFWPLNIDNRYDNLSVDYSWALLFSDRKKEALEYLKRTSATSPIERIQADIAEELTPLHYLDLAYAYAENGDSEQTRHLLTSEDAKYRCAMGYENDNSSSYRYLQHLQDSALQKMLKDYCPPQTDKK